MLSFKYFQEMLEEAKKKCKESSSEIELAHGEMLDKEEDDETEIKEQAPVAPVPGMKSKTHAIMVHPESKQRVTIDRKNVKNYPASEGWKEVAPGMKESVEEIEELSKDTLSSYASKAGKRLGGNIASLSKSKEISKMSANPTSPEEVKDRLSKGIAKRTSGLAGAAKRLTSEEVEELDEAAITHVVAKHKLAAHKEFMDKEGFDVTTKPLPKSHPKHSTHVGIVSKNSQESSYHEDGHAISESVELDEGDELAMRHKFVFNKTPAGKAREVARNREELKSQMKRQKEMGGITGPKGKLPEAVEELEEISTATMGHAGKTTLKHIKDPGVQLRMAAHDVKPGIKGYRDRVALMHAADAEGKLKKEAVSPFDWKAYAKEKGTASSGKTKTFHDVKKTSTGTVYTKQVNPDGTSKGSGDDAAKAAEVEQAPKRGRGRPAGVGARTGSYKPRDPAAKAASAAKAAASKAANRASRNEEFDNEFMGSLIEGFEDEDFDDFLQCEEFEELDEATQDALIDFINEKCASKMKESLTGNQHKLDKNKNGKIDSHDFKLLRKEETEQIQESVTSYAAFLSKKQ